GHLTLPERKAIKQWLAPLSFVGLYKPRAGVNGRVRYRRNGLMRGVMRGGAMALAIAMLLAGTSAQAAEAKRETAGKLADGTIVEAVTLSNARGISARIISFGATLQQL